MEHAIGTRSATRPRVGDWVVNVLVLLVTVAIAWTGAEIYVAKVIDDGMQFDLEMWRYAKYIKRQSASPAIGHEHTPNTRAHLMGADVAIWRVFADHHRYRAGDLAGLDAPVVVTTAKDAARLPPGFAAHVLRVEVAVERGEAALDGFLDAL